MACSAKAKCTEGNKRRTSSWKVFRLKSRPIREVPNRSPRKLEQETIGLSYRDLGIDFFYLTVKTACFDRPVFPNRYEGSAGYLRLIAPSWTSLHPSAERKIRDIDLAKTPKLLQGLDHLEPVGHLWLCQMSTRASNFGFVVYSLLI